MRAGYTVDDEATEAVQLVIIIIADSQRTKDHAELDAAVSGFLGLGEFAQSKAMHRCLTVSGRSIAQCNGRSHLGIFHRAGVDILLNPWIASGLNPQNVSIQWVRDDFWSWRRNSLARVA